MITRVQIVSIAVNDQERALEFYRDKLGFKVVTDAPDGQGGRWLELAIPGGQTHVVIYPPVGEGQRVGGFSNVLFAADDIRETHDELASRGIKITVPVTEQPWGTFFQFADPDGNEFLVSQVQDGQVSG